jgi:hypothetical protein
VFWRKYSRNGQRKILEIPSPRATLSERLNFHPEVGAAHLRRGLAINAFREHDCEPGQAARLQVEG